MKILIVAGQTHGFGGVETVVKKFYQLLSADPEFDCKLIICGPTKNQNSLNWLCDIPHKILAQKIPFRALVKWVAKTQIVKEIKCNKPDVIIAYDSFGTEISRYAINASKHNVKLISWPHFSFNTFSRKNQQRLLMADYHFAICDELKNQICQCGIDETNIFTIYNPVTKTDIVIPKPDNKTKLLYLGRVQYEDQKNLKELFEAISLIKGKFTLDIVGGCSSQEKEKLMQLADRLNISDLIYFHDWQNNPWQYVKTNIAQVTSLVMTSKFEGFGMVLVEAMSYGIYCVSSNCQTGPKDIIQENINGNLYSLGNINSLATILQSIVNHQKRSDYQLIKQSINHLYDDQYITNIKKVLREITHEIG